MSTIESVLNETRLFPPPATFAGDHLVHCHVAARELAACGGDVAGTAARVAASLAAAPAAAIG